MNKKVIVLGILAVCLSISIGIGFSYAVWSQTEKQTNPNLVQSGCFEIQLTNEENVIDLKNQFPITDEDGKKLTPYTFTVKNNCSVYASYAINLEILEGSDMDDQYIKVMLDDNEPVRFDNPNLQGATTVETNSIKSKTLAVSGVDAYKSNSHSLRMWLDESGTNETVGGKTLNSKIVISAAATEKPPTGADYIESLLAENSSTMIQDETDDKNIRYISATPNNYVTFNNEKWRIIGEFDNMWECPEDTEETKITTENYTTKCNQTKLLKIIRDEALSTFSWDSTSTSTNGGYGVNEWSTSAIQTALNTAYYNSQAGTCYGGSGKSSKDCDFSQDGNMKGLDATARNQLARVMWNTGTVDGTTNTETDVNTIEMYNAERSEHNGKICTQGEAYCNDNVTRATKWIGKVGLMYPSDYGYATSGGSSVNREQCLNYQLYSWDSGNYYSNCAQNSWLFNSIQTQWTMTPVPSSSSANYVFGVYSNGLVYCGYAYFAGGVRPVVYLKSDVKIIHDATHDGSEDHPYELSL